MNNKNDEKPWEKTFEEDRDEQGNYSRTANRRNAKNNTMLTTSLLIIFSDNCWNNCIVFYITEI